MTKAEAQHKAKLAGIGCMLCRRLYGHHEPGPVELHHLRTGGWGKGDYKTLIPLCREHHQGNTGLLDYYERLAAEREAAKNG